MWQCGGKETYQALQPSDRTMSKMNLQIDPTDNVIAKLRDLVVILHLEAQSVFSTRYKDYGWQATLGKPAAFFFNSAPLAMFHPHVVGTVEGESNTWIWAWDGAEDSSDDVFALSRKVHDLGEALQFLPFTTARHKIGQGPLGDDWKVVPYSGPECAVPADFMFAALALADLPTPLIYGGPTGKDGSVIWFVLENEDEFSLPPAKMATSLAAITEALRAGLIANHRDAVLSYAQKREGITVSESSSGIKLSLMDGHIDVIFGQDGLISSLEGSA